MDGLSAGPKSESQSRAVTKNSPQQLNWAKGRGFEDCESWPSALYPIASTPENIVILGCCTTEQFQSPPIGF
jgi:hypothetical protein